MIDYELIFNSIKLEKKDLESGREILGVKKEKAKGRIKFSKFFNSNPA